MWVPRGLGWDPTRSPCSLPFLEPITCERHGAAAGCPDGPGMPALPRYHASSPDALAVALDARSRRIGAWAMAPRMMVAVVERGLYAGLGYVSPANYETLNHAA